MPHDAADADADVFLQPHAAADSEADLHLRPQRAGQPAEPAAGASVLARARHEHARASGLDDVAAGTSGHDQRHCFGGADRRREHRWRRQPRRRQ